MNKISPYFMPLSLIFTCLALLVLPFNGLPWLRLLLHEIAREASFYAISLAILFYVLAMLSGKARLEFPARKSFYIFLIFMAWIVISDLVNLPHLLSTSFRGRPSIVRSVLQMAVLMYGFVNALFFYNLSRQQSVDWLFLFKRFLLIGFIVTCAYSLVEIVLIYKITPLMPLCAAIHGSLSPYLHLGLPAEFPLVRLSSICYEPASLGVYAAVLTPFIYAGMVYGSCKKKYYIMAFFLYLMLILSISRSSYLVAAASVLVITFFTLLWADKMYKRHVLFAIVYSALCVLLITMFLPDSKHKNLYRLTSVMRSFGWSPKQAYSQRIRQIQVEEKRKRAGPPLQKYSEEEQKAVKEEISKVAGGAKESNLIRLGHMMTSLRIGMAHPVFGAGLGQDGYLFKEYVPQWATYNWWIKKDMEEEMQFKAWPETYSLHTRIIAELGFVGFILWAVFWVALFVEHLATVKTFTRAGEAYPSYFSLALLGSMCSMLCIGLVNGSFRPLGYWITVGLIWFLYEYAVQAPGGTETAHAGNKRDHLRV
ncbi:O-antigen ligase family protein [candidate division FCPU426 bacterium]|nr:O-antigen ligase family protein [candidate division FCPU426 bacterium]